MRRLGMNGYDNKRKPSIVAFVNTTRCLSRRFIMGFHSVYVLSLFECMFTVFPLVQAHVMDSF